MSTSEISNKMSWLPWGWGVGVGCHPVARAVSIPSLIRRHLPSPYSVPVPACSWGATTLRGCKSILGGGKKCFALSVLWPSPKRNPPQPHLGPWYCMSLDGESLN